jgi:hypothetical protein
MTAGKLNLVSQNSNIELDIINIGIEEENPKFSFFDTVYRRHTNFSLDNKQLQVEGTADFGNKVTLSFQQNGDLVGDIYFEITLPPATDCFSSMPNSYANWTNAVGFAMIEYVKLKVGGVVVDDQSGLWFDLQNELTDPNKKQWPLVGKVDDPLKLKFFQRKSTRYIVPLRFSFNKTPGLAIPIFLTGIDKTEFEIEVKFKSLANLLVHDGGTVNSTSIAEFQAFGTYYSLENYEKTRIRNYRQAREYNNGQLIHLIETVQPFTFNSGTFTLNDVRGSIKELVWVLQHNDRTSTSNPIIRDNVALSTHCGNDHFNYSGTSLLSISGREYDTLDPFAELTISIGNQFDYDTKSAFYYRQYLPYKYHSNVPNNYVYSFPFCLHPEDYQPSGTFNIINTNSDIRFQLTSVPANYVVKIFAVSYRFLRMNTNSASVQDVRTFTSSEYFYDTVNTAPPIPAAASTPSSRRDSSRSTTVTGDFNQLIVNQASQIQQLNAIIQNQNKTIQNLSVSVNSLNKKMDDIRKVQSGGRQVAERGVSTIAGAKVRNYYKKY